MRPETRQIMNQIMAEAAREARVQLQQHPDMDLLPLWVNTLAKLASATRLQRLHFRMESSPESIERLCRGRPWSFQRFKAYVKSSRV